MHRPSLWRVLRQRLHVALKRLAITIQQRVTHLLRRALRQRLAEQLLEPWRSCLKPASRNTPRFERTAVCHKRSCTRRTSKSRGRARFSQAPAGRAQSGRDRHRNDRAYNTSGAMASASSTRATRGGAPAVRRWPGSPAVQSARGPADWRRCVRAASGKRTGLLTPVWPAPSLASSVIETFEGPKSLPVRSR